MLEQVTAAVSAVSGNHEDWPSADARFYDDLGFDSVMLMQLKYQIEELVPELDELSLPDMLGSMVTLSTLADYLDELLAPETA